MFCMFCKKFGHSAYNCYHRRFRFHSRSKPSYLRKRGKVLFKSDKITKTEPTKIIADSNSADQSKEISDSNSVDFIWPITDSNSVDLKPITESNSVDTVEINDDSNSSEEFDNLIKSIVKKPSPKVEISDYRLTPNDQRPVSKCETCQNLRDKINKLKRTVKDLRAENLSLNLLYFSSENTKFFDNH